MHRFRILLFITLIATFGSLMWSGQPQVFAQSEAQKETLLVPAVEEALITHLGYKPTTQILVDNIEYATDWSFGTVAVFAGDHHGSPLAYRFLAQYSLSLKKWDVAFDYTEKYDTWIVDAPHMLIPQDLLNLTLNRYSPDGNGAGMLSLPWAIGESMSMSSGPHSFNDNNTHPRPYSGIDFTGGSGAVRAASGGVVSRPCANLIVVDHGNGWQTNYYHVRNIAVSNNETVSRGQLLGYTSAEFNCGGGATGPHVHFDVKNHSNFIDINGVDIGGWTVEETGYRTGCFVKGADRRCTGGNTSIYNDGTIGSGTSPAPPHNIEGYIDGIPATSTKSGTYRLHGWARTTNADVSISRVEVYINNTYVGNATYPVSHPAVPNRGWEWNWNTATYGNGTYKVQAKAVSQHGKELWLRLGLAQNQDYATVTVSNTTHPCLKPVYRYTLRDSGRHFYTITWSDLGVGSATWKYEGIAGYMAASASCYMPNAKPLYRLRKVTSTKYFYTMSSAEKDYHVGTGEFVYEGVAGYMASAPQTPYLTTPLYRLYKASNDDHFYTTSATERDQAVQNGYTNEPVVGYWFKLGNIKPNLPTLNLPPNNATQTSTSVTLKWADAGDPDTYPRTYRDFEAKIRKDGSTWAQTRAWSQTASWTLTLPSAGKYCWKVQAGDGTPPTGLMSGFSTERCFTVLNPPTPTPTKTATPTPTKTATPAPTKTPTPTPVQGIQGKINGPVPSAVLTDTVWVSGWAQNPQSPIQKVEVWINDSFVGQAAYDTNQNWRWQWNTWYTTNGAYRIKVKAVSADGSSRWLTSAANNASEVTVQVNNKIPPKSLYIDTPTANQSITEGTVQRISGWAADSNFTYGTGVDKVALYLDGPAGTGRFIDNATYGVARSDLLRIYGPRYEKAGYSYQWDTSGLQPGEHTLYVYAHSLASGWYSKTRIINIQADPSLDCTMSINAGAAYTSQRDTVLGFNVANATQMLVSNDAGFSGTQWQPYQSLAAWQLNDIGARMATVNVYARFRSAQGAILCGNTSISDDIIYDGVKPRLEGLVFAEQARTNQAIAAQIQLMADDGPDGSGISALQISESSTFTDAEWLPYADRLSWSLTSGTTLYIRVRDGAGNMSAPITKQVSQRYQVYLPLTIR